MASNPPGSCCFMGFYHEGEPKGTYKDLFGIHTYVNGYENNDKVIVIMTDVFGNKLNNTLLIADQFADAGYQVYIPDILFGDCIEKLDGSVDIEKWKNRHNKVATKAITDQFMLGLKKEYSPKFIAVVGYCFGAKYAVQQVHGTHGVADVCAIAHPSYVEAEELREIGTNKPILISAAEEDSIFSAELRHFTEETLAKLGLRYQLDLFSGVQHGYAVRGDTSDPVIKYAKEKTLLDHIYWFETFSKSLH
ncbi:probable protein AIM2 [Zygosaccharomyces bailii]|nr:probable protein AIM2 [Zygosaccharomyces bailii]